MLKHQEKNLRTINHLYISSLIQRQIVIILVILQRLRAELNSILKKFYGRHRDLVNPYNVAVSRIVSDVFASDAP